MRDCLLEPRKGTLHSLHDLLRYEAANLIAKTQYDATVPHPANADVDFAIVDSLVELDHRQFPWRLIRSAPGMIAGRITPRYPKSLIRA